MASNSTSVHLSRRSAQGPAGLQSFALSLRAFLRNPSMVGSAFPASRQMVARMFEDVPWREIGLFVEFGPGTGRFTHEALARLGPRSTVVAIDTSADFIENLKRVISDPRLIAVQGSAEQIGAVLKKHGLGRADCIVSGIPFSTLEPRKARQIMDASCAALTDKGRFLAYQMRQAIEPLLEQRFLHVDSRYEWRNIPPCHLYTASGLRLPMRTHR